MAAPSTPEMRPVRGCGVCLRLSLDLADAKVAMRGERVADIAVRFRRHLDLHLKPPRRKTG